VDELPHGPKNTMDILMAGQNNIDLIVTGRSGRGRYINTPFHPHKILYFESKSTVTHHPATSRLEADKPKWRVIQRKMPHTILNLAS